MKHLLLSILILLLSTGFTFGQANATQLPSWRADDYAEKPKVGLALSGGAAHGLAHIGVMKYMEEIGIEIDYITGTSMGAIVGGLYAVGYDADQCAEVAATIDWGDILSNNVALTEVSPIEKYNHQKYPLSLVIKNGEFIIPEGILPRTKLDLKIEELFAAAYHIDDFNDLPIPFACCAVDIVEGEVVTMNSGKLTESIRASMAIPSIFKPVEVNGKLLVDGGLIRNFPVSDNIDMGADIVVGSYVGSMREEADDLGSLVKLLKQSAFMMSLRDTDRQMSLADIVLLPEVKDLPVFDFDGYQDLIDAGYEAAVAQEAAFLKLKELTDHFERAPAKPRLDNPGFIFIDEVIIDGVSPFAQRIIRDKMALKERSFTTFEKINDGIKSIYATKNFKDVSYELVPGKDGNKLLLTTTENKSTSIGVNLNHFSSTNSALIASVEARNYFGQLSQLNLKFRLSDNIGFASEYYKRSTFLKDGLIFGLSGKAERYEVPFYNKSTQVKGMSQWELLARPFALWEPNNDMYLQFYWEARYLTLKNEIEAENDIVWSDARLYSLGLSYNYNTLDKSSFPTDGVEVECSFKWTYSPSLKVRFDEGFNIERIKQPRPYLKNTLSFRSYHPLSKSINLGFMLRGQYMARDFFMDNTFVGGSFQNRADRLAFIGMEESQLQLSTYGYGRLELRWNVWSILYTSFVSNIALGKNPTQYYISNENETDFVRRVGVGVSFGLDLPIGPFNIDVGFIPKEVTRIYFGLGYRHIL